MALPGRRQVGVRRTTRRNRGQPPIPHGGGLAPPTPRPMITDAIRQRHAISGELASGQVSGRRRDVLDLEQRGRAALGLHRGVPTPNSDVAPGRHEVGDRRAARWSVPGRRRPRSRGPYGGNRLGKAGGCPPGYRRGKESVNRRTAPRPAHYTSELSSSVSVSPFRVLLSPFRDSPPRCLGGRLVSDRAVVPPAPTVRWLVRPRLLERLAPIRDGGLGMVVAPVGSGKTTLLRQWARGRQHPVAWYAANPVSYTHLDVYKRQA